MHQNDSTVSEEYFRVHTTPNLAHNATLVTLSATTKIDLSADRRPLRIIVHVYSFRPILPDSRYTAGA